MPYSICAPILELDMSDRSLFETYEQELGLKLHRGSRSIEARVANGEVAACWAVNPPASRGKTCEAASNGASGNGEPSAPRLRDACKQITSKIAA